MVATRSRTAARRASGDELTESQKQAYWRYNIKLTTVLLAIDPLQGRGCGPPASPVCIPAFSRVGLP
jgi:hypothetical protein